MRPAPRPLFRVALHVAGPVEPESGWLMDFADLKERFKPLYDRSTTTT